MPTCLPLTKSKLVFAEPERCLLPMVLVSDCAWAVKAAVKISAAINVIFFRDIEMRAIYFYVLYGQDEGLADMVAWGNIKSRQRTPQL